MDNKKNILVTGSGGPLGVNVTRSLRKGMQDFPMHLVGTECNHYHTHLSITDETLLIPPAKQTKEYLDALDQIIAKHNIHMILPTHPVEVRTISEHRARFADRVRLFLPDHDVILCAQSKWETYKKLKAANLPLPYTAFINNEHDVEQLFDSIETRPIWVRGAGVPGAGIGVASLPCREAKHAAAWIDHWQGWGYFIGSEYLPGQNLTWCGLYSRGELIASQSRERLEYVLPHVSPSGITGAPAVSRTVKNELLFELGDKAIKCIMPKPHGVFFVDFKADDHQSPRITEINAGRFGTTIHFYTEAGCNFPLLLVKLSFDEAIPNTPLIDPIAEHTYWIRTLDCGPALVRDIDE